MNSSISDFMSGKVYPSGSFGPTKRIPVKPTSLVGNKIFAAASKNFNRVINCAKPYFNVSGFAVDLISPTAISIFWSHTVTDPLQSKSSSALFRKWGSLNTKQEKATRPTPFLLQRHLSRCPRSFRRYTRLNFGRSFWRNLSFGGADKPLIVVVWGKFKRFKIRWKRRSSAFRSTKNFH